ncbi:MAG: aminoacyl-tRNA hydrolase [Kiloniellales bacterium]|nr:aminoacyl-tRNA hydrolase [Kiloniellales bacterium]
MIKISPTLEIDEREIEERFIHASGPGGQNVNKLATAVQLRFDVSALPDDLRARLKPLAGRRLTRDGELIITARRFRTQERNRQDALARLTELLRRASEFPRRRRPTRPTKASRERRLEAKTQRSAKKRDRRRPEVD